MEDAVYNITLGDAEQIQYGQDIGAAFAVSLIATYLQVYACNNARARAIDLIKALY